MSGFAQIPRVPITSTVAISPAITTATPLNVTSISLPPGEWDVSGSVGFAPNNTTTISRLEGSISTTTGTLDETVGNYSRVDYASGGVVVGFGVPTFSIPVRRFSLAVTTTVFLVARADFGTSTMAVGGSLVATPGAR